MVLLLDNEGEASVQISSPLLVLMTRIHCNFCNLGKNIICAHISVARARGR